MKGGNALDFSIGRKKKAAKGITKVRGQFPIGEER